MKKPIWKKIATRIIYETKWTKLREDSVIQPDGKESVYTFLDTPESCMVMALDIEDKSLILINEYRYPIGKAIWQFPSGVVEESMTPLENSKKELFEETGIVAKKWKKLKEIYSFPGKTTNLLHIFLATDLNLDNLKIHQEGNESIYAIEKIKIFKIKKMIESGEINSSETLAALNIFFMLDYEKNNGFRNL